MSLKEAVNPTKRSRIRRRNNTLALNNNREEEKEEEEMFKTHKKFKEIEYIEDFYFENNNNITMKNNSNLKLNIYTKNNFNYILEYEEYNTLDKLFSENTFDILEKYPDVKSYKNLLLLAFKYNRLDVIAHIQSINKFIIDSINFKNETLLYISVFNNNLELQNLLFNNYYRLNHKILEKHLRLVTSFSSSSINVITLGCKINNIILLKRLFGENLDLFFPKFNIEVDFNPLLYYDNDNNNILYYAAINPLLHNICLRVISEKVLLDNVFNINVKNNDAENYLTIIFGRGYVKLINNLFDNYSLFIEKPDLNTTNKDGDTLLILLLKNKLVNEALRLLDFDDIDINIINNDGKDALFYSKLYFLNNVSSILQTIIDREKDNNKDLEETLKDESEYYHVHKDLIKDKKPSKKNNKKRLASEMDDNDNED